MRYRALREYRDRYPSLVVLTAKDEFPAVSKAVEAVVPATTRAGMRPLAIVKAPRESAWCMGRPGEQLLVYTMTGAPVELELGADTAGYDVQWIDATTAAVHRTRARIAGGAPAMLTPPDGGAGRAWVAWLVRRK